MSLNKILLVVALCFIALVAAQDDPGVAQDGVLDLTPDNFDKEVGGDAAALVEFYAPWCGHCKNLVPEYAKLGAAVIASGSKKVIVAKVNAEAHGELGSRFGVSGFPTIKFFPANSKESEDYNGGRDAASFVKFLNEKSGASLFIPKDPTYVTVLNNANFDKVVMDKNADVLVEFYAPWCGHCKRLAPDYEIVAKTFQNEKNVVVANVDADEGENKALGSRFGVTGFPTIKFFPKDNKDGEDYNGGRTPEDFVTFLNEKSGAKRSVGGALNAEAGKDEQLDNLAHDFITAESAARKDVQAKIDARVAEVGTKDAKNYAAAAKKILEKGEEYVTKEIARLEKMLAGKVSLERRDAFTVKKNILGSFKSE